MIRLVFGESWSQQKWPDIEKGTLNKDALSNSWQFGGKLYPQSESARSNQLIELRSSGCS